MNKMTPELDKVNQNLKVEQENAKVIFLLSMILGPLLYFFMRLIPNLKKNIFFLLSICS